MNTSPDPYGDLEATRRAAAENALDQEAINRAVAGVADAAADEAADQLVPQAAQVPPAFQKPVPNGEVSIVDEILNLDEFLSSDVRRAEKTARICTRPDLEADIDELEAKLAMLVDATGRPYAAAMRDDDEALVSAASSHDTTDEVRDILNQIHAKRQDMASAMRSIRMRQLPEDKWEAFRVQWREVMEAEDYAAKRPMFDALIVACASSPTISAEQLRTLRSKLGKPQIEELSVTAWNVNVSSGVSVPKSPLSSLVLRQQTRG